MTDTETEQRPNSWDRFRWIVAAVLLLAACVKILDTPQILAGDGLLNTLPRLLTVIGFESATAFGLLIVTPGASWRLTLVIFGVFSVTAAYAAYSGMSCNCFGERLDPQFLFILDVAVLVVTALLRPRQIDSTSRWGLCFLVGAVTASLFCAAALWRNQTVDRSEPLEFLLADQLQGKAWPLNDSLHPDLSPLRSGNWLVLVVRRDCEHCRELLGTHFSDPTRARDGERTAVFVAGQDTWPFALDRISMELAHAPVLTWENSEPFVASPAVFVLQDGTVTQAADGQESEALMHDLF